MERVSRAGDREGRAAAAARGAAVPDERGGPLRAAGVRLPRAGVDLPAAASAPGGRRQRRPQPALRPLPLRRWRRRAGGRPRARSTSPACGSRLPRTCRTRLAVVERSGCDRRPIDSRRARAGCSSSRRSGRIRSTRLDDCAARSRWPRASPRASSAPRSTSGCRACSTSHAAGVTTVVYHAIVYEYFTDAVRQAFHEALDRAGRARHARRPARLAALRIHPGHARLRATLTTWPGGEERVVATAGAHGSDVRRPRS